MNLSDIPSAFQSKLRLAVVAALLSGPKSFKQLRELTESTDGNLGRQLELLREAGLVQAEKLGTRSDFSLTQQGRELFAEYVQLLQSLLGGAQEGTA